MHRASVDSKRRPGLSLLGSTQATDTAPRRLARCHPFRYVRHPWRQFVRAGRQGLTFGRRHCTDVISSTPIDERETMTDVTRSIWTLVLSNVAVRPVAACRVLEKRTFTDFAEW